MPRLSIKHFTMNSICIDLASGEKRIKEIFIELVTANPLFLSEEEGSLKHHFIPDKAKYAIFHSAPKGTNKDAIVWRVIRLGRSPYKCISAMRFGMLCEAKQNELIKFARCCRYATGQNTKKSGARLIKNVDRG